MGEKMDEYRENTTVDKREEIKRKLRQYYDGRIVRKDLTKSIREGANVPVYVLEYLLGQYCNSDDDEIIEEGVENVKRILRDNYVRPDEAQKILSLLRERGSYTVIDRITVVLNTKEDRYEATFSNLWCMKTCLCLKIPHALLYSSPFLSESSELNSNI